MKTLLLAVLAAVAAVLTSLPAFAQAPTHTFYIFKVSATIPVSITTIGVQVDKITTKTLKTADIVNLALGQAPGTKLPSNLFLAMSLAFEDIGQPTLSKLIVCDNSQTGPALVKTVVAVGNTLDFDVAYLGARRKGSGFGTGAFQTTTLGDPAKWALLTSTFSGSGLSSGPLFRGTPLTPIVSPVATATIQGRMKFRITDRDNVTTNYDGIVTRAAFKLTGKILGTYDE